MRLPSLSRRARLWGLWAFVIFGLMNAFGPALDAWRRADDQPAASWGTLRARQAPVERFFTTLRDDSDVRRYFAYAQATLGRPYAGDFVRPAGATDEGALPDPTRIVAPDRPLRPWRDFVVEYPPGMMAAVLVPALFTGDEDAYVRIFAIEMELALTLAVLLAVRTADRLRPGAGDEALKHATLLALALGVIAVRRYDPLVALALAAAVHALALRRFTLAGAALALGIVVKGVPLLIAPVFLFHALARRDGRELALGVAGAGATLAVVGAAYLRIAGPHGLDALAYHGARPIQIQTLYSGLALLGSGLGLWPVAPHWGYGSLNLGATAEPGLRALSSAFLALGLLAAWVGAARRLAAARDEGERMLTAILASLASLIAFITLGKVFSPQYCVWLIPLAAAAAPLIEAERRKLLIYGFALVQAEYPFLYALLYATLTPAAGVIIVARTACLWTYAVRAWRSPVARDAGTETAHPGRPA